MNLLAVTAIEAMKTMPKSTWLAIFIVITAIICAVIFIPKIFKMNKVILGVIVVVGSSIFFFSWVKQRNEPAILTPLIDRIAPFFDSDVQYKKKEKKLPK